MSSKAETLARRLLRENRKKGRSWRVIAREDYQNRIPFGTLCRFALSNGAWLPKHEHQIVLGLKHERKQKPQQPKDLFDMATSTLRNALINREEMPPLDPRMVKQFVKLGWIKSARSMQ